MQEMQSIDSDLEKEDARSRVNLLTAAGESANGTSILPRWKFWHRNKNFLTDCGTLLNLVFTIRRSLRLRYKRDYMSYGARTVKSQKLGCSTFRSHKQFARQNSTQLNSTHPPYGRMHT